MDVHDYSSTLERNRILCSGLQEAPRSTSAATSHFQAGQAACEAAKFNRLLHSQLRSGLLSRSQEEAVERMG